MAELTIITNNHARPVLNGYELTEKERKEFDYYDAETLDSCSFFRYKSQIYDLGEFMRVKGDDLKNWHGIRSDSYFSGLLVRFTNDNEGVIIGRFFS